MSNVKKIIIFEKYFLKNRIFIKFSLDIAQNVQQELSIISRIKIWVGSNYKFGMILGRISNLMQLAK